MKIWHGGHNENNGNEQTPIQPFHQQNAWKYFELEYY